MKFGSLFVSLLISFSTVVAQQNAVTIRPAKPTIGDTITVIYHPQAPDAKIKNPNSLSLVFGEYSSFHQQPPELSMEKDGKSWTVSWPVSQNATFSTFYFKSDSKTDKGPQGHIYEILIYEDGHPIKKALRLKRLSIDERYNNEQTIDSLQVALLKKKTELYPEDFLGRVNLLEAKIDKNTGDSLKLRQKGFQVLNNKLQQHPDSSALVKKVIRGYNILGAKTKADSLKDAFIDEHPYSQLAIRRILHRAQNMDHSKERLRKLKKVARYTNSPMSRSGTYNELFEYYRKEDNAAKMAAYAKRAESTPWPWKATQLNTFAKGFAEQGDSLQLALLYAEKALQAVPNEVVGTVILGPLSDREAKPYLASFVKDSTDKAEREQLKGDIYATFGAIQMKRQNFKLAEKYLENAIESSNSISAQKHLAELYLQTDRPEQAYNTYWNILRQNPGQEKMKGKFKQAYTISNGSTEGFEDQLNKLKEAWRNEMRIKFNNERISKEAPPLTSIVDLQGDPIDKKKFHNKVLFINLWNTRCEQCIDIMPEIQEAYQAYKDNPEVKFISLANGNVNSREEIVEWIKNKELDLPWYYDRVSSTTKAFERKGIPMIIVIDQKGMIQFKTLVGTRKSIAEKIKLRIDMLLNEEGTKQ